MGILCLFMPIPIVGAIMMWFIAPWSLKTKRIIIGYYIGLPILIGLIVLIFFMGGSRARNSQKTAVDLRREAQAKSMLVYVREYCVKMNTCPISLLELNNPNFSLEAPYSESVIKSLNIVYKVIENGQNCEIITTLSLGEIINYKCFE